MTDSTTVSEIPSEIAREFELLTSNAVEVLPRQEFIFQLMKSKASGKPLRIKYGADPSAPDIHLGHSVAIRKLRQFQDLGHTVVFIIGGYTARIGDPSGRNSQRPRLSKEQVQANAETYMDQMFKILDRNKTEVVDNSKWLEPLDVTAMIELMSRFTVSQMLEREDFSKRFNSEVPIYLHEFIYPLLQGYDSVAVRSDVELGGTDQRFNLLMGRELQRLEGQAPQTVMVMPLLVGLDGSHKMSKSLGNYIGIDESPGNMFGKAMSIPDELMESYYSLALGSTPEAMKTFTERLQSGNLHPRDAKMELAARLTDLYHGDGSGQAQKEDFIRRFSSREFPEETAERAEFRTSEAPTLQALLVALQAGKSSRELQRLVSQKAVKFVDHPSGFAPNQDNPLESLKSALPVGEYRLKIGKTRFALVSIRD